MLNIGFGEILLIGCLLLVVVGPERLPKMLRIAGRQYAKLRRAAHELQHAFMDEGDLLDAGIDDDILPPSTSVHRPSRTKRDPNKPLTPAQRALEAKAAKQAKEDGAATEPPAPAPAADTVPHKPATEPAPDKPAPDPEPRESDLSTED